MVRGFGQRNSGKRNYPVSILEINEDAFCFAHPVEIPETYRFQTVWIEPNSTPQSSYCGRSKVLVWLTQYLTFLSQYDYVNILSNTRHNQIPVKIANLKGMSLGSRGPYTVAQKLVDYWFLIQESQK